MANKVYRFKRLALSHKKLRIKAWCKPVYLIRKVKNLTCEGCFFDRKVNDKVPDLTLCDLMSKDRQGLPGCVSMNGKQQYIFVRTKKQQQTKLL
jgi:hypothetical protein